MAVVPTAAPAPVPAGAIPLANISPSDITAAPAQPQGLPPGAVPLSSIQQSDLTQAPQPVPVSQMQPGDLMSQTDYLSKLPTAQITKAVPDDLREAYVDGTMNKAQQAEIQPYLDAYKAKAGKLEYIQTNDLPTAQQTAQTATAAPLDTGSTALDTALNVLAGTGKFGLAAVGSLFSVPTGHGFVTPTQVGNAGSALMEGAATQAVETTRGLFGVDPFTGPLSDKDASQSASNAIAGPELGTLQAANMLRQFTNRVANRFYQGTSMASTAYETQFKHDLMWNMAEEGATQGSGVPSTLPAPDAGTVKTIAQSPFAQPNVLIPGAEGLGAGEDAGMLAARTLSTGAGEALPTTIRKAAGQVVGGGLKATAAAVRPVTSAIESNPLLAGAVAAGASYATGAPLGDILMTGLVGAGEGKLKLLGKMTDGLENYGNVLAGKVPPGPIGRFAVSAFDTVAPHLQSAVAAQLANTPFLLGADDEDQFKGTLAGGLLAHAGGSAATGLTNALDIGKNLWAARPTLPETRLPIKPYGTDETLDAAHQNVMNTLDNSGNNFVQAVRDYFGKQKAQLYTLFPQDYSNALDKAAAAGHITQDTANQGKAQQGITYTVPADPADPQSVPQQVALSKVTQNTPGVSVGHEAGHLLESLLSPDELSHVYGQIYDTYGPDQFNAYKQKYTSLANATLNPGDTPVAPLTDRQTASEIFAEHVSAVLNSQPIAQFSDPTMKAPLDLARNVYSLVGRGLEKLGVKTPQLVPENIGSSVTTGTGIEPSAKLGNIVTNILAAHQLDTPLFDGTQKLGEAPPAPEPVTPVSPNATELPNSRPVEEKPKQVGFKKGDPIGIIRNKAGTVVAEHAKINKTLGEVDGERYYEVEYTHPDTGKPTLGNVPESWLQSAEPNKPAGAEGAKPSDAVQGPKSNPGLPTSKANEAPQGGIPVASHIRSSGAEQNAAFGKQATPEDIAHNKALVGKIIGNPTAPGAIEIVHNGAPSDVAEPNQIVRERQRLSGGETQANQKVIVPIKETPSKSEPGIFALDSSKILQNKAILAGWLKENASKIALSGDLSDASRRLAAPDFNTKLQAYLQNQTHGYGGGGEELVRPKDTRPGTIPERDPNYTPTKLADPDVQLLNALMGYHVARSKRGAAEISAADYFRRFAEGSGRKVENVGLGGKGVGPLAETNPLRATLTKAGFNSDLLNQATSQIRYRDIIGKAKPRPDLNLSPGSTGITKAGFMPDVAPKTDTPEFKQWFGGSKIVDEKGDPQVLYHGSREDFNVFNKDRIRPNDYDAPFNGFWFTTEKGAASPAMVNPAHVRDFYLSIKNPATPQEARAAAKYSYENFEKEFVPRGARADGDAARMRLQDLGYDGVIWEDAPKIKEEEFNRTGKTFFKSHRGATYSLVAGKEGGTDLFKHYGGEKNAGEHITGYDTGLKDFKDQWRDRVVVAFEPEQIKSATGNKGTFDPKNPDIRFMPNAEQAPVENEHAKFIGHQEGFGETPGFNLYNLKHDIEGHPEGSTVSEATLRKAGLPVPGLREQGNQETRDTATQYMKNSGKEFVPHTDYARVNPERAKALADFYEEAKHAPNNPDVQKAYRALTDETRAQWDAMTAAGIKAEPYEGKGEPYKDSAAMMKDVRENKHLFFLPTEGNFSGLSGNPLMENSGIKVNGHELVNNDLFRAVHDYFGHTAEGYEFGPRGEYNAYLAHSKMFSDEAKPALAAETLAQNSWVNYGKHLRRPDGSIPEKGDADFKPLAKRPFAEQKSVAVPASLLAEGSSGVAPDIKFMPPVDPSREHVESAAVEIGGRVFTGEYHQDALHKAHAAGAIEQPEYDGYDRKQGFVTSTGRFISREEAFKLARASGQVSQRKARVEEDYAARGKRAPALDAADMEHKYNPDTAVKFMPPADPSKEHVDRAAIRFTDGTIVTHEKDTNHEDLFNYHTDLEKHGEEADEGFISSTGRFLSREEAFKLARASGQIKNKRLENSKVKNLWNEDINPKFMPATEMKLPHSVPEDTLHLVHYGQPGLTETDPAKFGRSGLTSRSELSAEPRSYFYVKGHENPDDPSTERQHVYETSVPGNSIYNGDKDKLNYRGNINRSAADAMLQKAGYKGIHRTAGGDAYRQVELYNKQPITPRNPDGSTGRPGTSSFMPSPSKEPFYDTIDRALDSWQPKGTPEQLLAHLAKTRGTKEQAAWIGLDDFLKNKTSVTKQDVRDFVRQNAVHVQDVKLSPEGTFGPDDEEAQAAGDTEGIEGETKYESYQLPGGSNYRELLLTLPQEKTPSTRYRVNGQGPWTQLEDSQTGRTLHEGGYGAMRDRAADLNAAEAGNTTPPFKSSHFEEPNVLAHVRYNEREVPQEFNTELNDIEHRIVKAVGAKSASSLGSGAPSAAVLKGAITPTEARKYAQLMGWKTTDNPEGARGSKMLFLEEVQSDWHQKGRASGYKSADNDAKRMELQKYSDELKTQLRADQRSLEKHIPNFDFRNREHARMIYDMLAHSPVSQKLTPELNRVEQQLMAMGPSLDSVPDAPFKTTWPALAMKRMIRLAAEKGMDKIGWTTGEQQAERYDLSKQIDSIAYRKTPEGYQFDAIKDNSVPLHKSRLTIAQVEEHLGKEIAKKMEAGEGDDAEDYAGPGPAWKELSGVDLKVGGEGMKGFYDKILPSVANELGKKFGTKVDTAHIPGSGASQYELDRSSLDVHSMDITPEMKASALQGMPMFQPEAAKGLSGEKPTRAKAPGATLAGVTAQKRKRK